MWVKGGEIHQSLNSANSGFHGLNKVETMKSESPNPPIPHFLDAGLSTGISALTDGWIPHSEAPGVGLGAQTLD